MTTRRLRDDEREGIERIKASLYEWAFEDVKRAASPQVALPRLAFIGLASWIDTVSRLYGGNSGEPAWKKFIRAYLPEEFHDDKNVRLLYDGFRCAMSHEYGTRRVAPTARAICTGSPLQPAGS